VSSVRQPRRVPLTSLCDNLDFRSSTVAPTGFSGGSLEQGRKWLFNRHGHWAIAALEMKLARPETIHFAARAASLQQLSISTDIILGHSYRGEPVFKPLPYRAPIVRQDLGQHRNSFFLAVDNLAVAPSSMTSGTDPQRKASTGVPHAIASIIGCGWSRRRR
jgi:hypothetical protein